MLTAQHNNKGIKNAKHMSRKKLSDDHFLMTSFGSLSAKKQKVYRWVELRGSTNFFMFISFLFFLRCDDECCPTLEKTRDSAHLKAQHIYKKMVMRDGTIGEDDHHWWLL